MIELIDARALTDVATTIDRLLLCIDDHSKRRPGPILAEVSSQVHGVTQIISDVTGEISACLADRSSDTGRAVAAYCSALAPLGQAATELARLQEEIIALHFAAPRLDPSAWRSPRPHATEGMMQRCTAAKALLAAASTQLRIGAAPSSTPTLSPADTRTAARARSPHAPARPAVSAPPVPPAPASLTVAPATAKSR
ncbi:hypothetical protein [Streptomyces sp. CA-111067]|uniref:hypothetical protein n=1 Tax=Streptomyces sp. CA-111067 TaxID=3240046 RepID=UPI003D99581D